MRIAPLSLALWRGTEAAAISAYPLKRPILDIGCGFGEFGGVFFESNVEMGVDINERDLLRAAATGLYRENRRADARLLPFRAESFRTIISVSTIEHITGGHRQVFREMFRVLKPGGQLIFTVPTAHLYQNLVMPKIFEALGLHRWASGYFRLYNRAFKHVYLPDPGVWKRLVEQARFSIDVFEGTLNATTIALFELFLPTAFISQIGRVFFGSRFVISPRAREALAQPFARFVEADPKNLANVLIVAHKPVRNRFKR